MGRKIAAYHHLSNFYTNVTPPSDHTSQLNITPLCHLPRTTLPSKPSKPFQPNTRQQQGEREPKHYQYPLTNNPKMLQYTAISPFSTFYQLCRFFMTTNYPIYTLFPPNSLPQVTETATMPIIPLKLPAFSNRTNPPVENIHNLPNVAHHLPT